jgi:glycosyltransferase involved in cell wall biosynthesis
MKVYRQDDLDDFFAPLYTRARAMPGVQYAGSVSQTELARLLRRTTVLSYPCIFAETGCLAVLEAMAAGAYVVTSDLAALPETTMGMATLSAPPGDCSSVEHFGLTFSGHLRSVLRQWRRDPRAFAAARYEQVRPVNDEYGWKLRATQWEQALAAWLRGNA